VKYLNLQDLQRNLPKEVGLPWCVTENSADTIKLAVVKYGSVHMEVVVRSVAGSLSDSLLASVFVQGIPAPKLDNTLETVKLRTFLNDLLTLPLCCGVTDGDLQSLAEFPDGTTGRSYCRYVHHDVTHDTATVTHKSCVRAKLCELVLPKTNSDTDTSALLCKACATTERSLKEKLSKMSSKDLLDVKPNDPLHGISREQLLDAFKLYRKKMKKLEFREKLKSTETVLVSETLHNDLLAGISTEDIKDPLAQLFWQEQMKAFRNKNHGMRWHPMMIRLAILLHSKSKAVYEMLRETGILKLPGSSTLSEYTKADSPKEGFQSHVQEELMKKAEKLDSNKRYVSLLHDEMTVKADLVFDRASGELVGFVSGQQDRDFNVDAQELATHALCFYVVGVNSTLKMSVGFFATGCSKAEELYPLFWDAVSFVEETGLKVVVSTSDKAPENQKLYALHGEPGEHEVCFKTVNLGNPGPDDRFIYFISDPPHLLKTIRNNLASSGSGSNTKLLWNNGHHLLWRHIADLYYQDQRNGLARLPRLSRDHISLTSHSIMKVKLAAQVLSCTVGSVMEAYGPEEAQETARFIKLVDRFFDCLNVRHLDEAHRKRKPDLRAYTEVEDVRFAFLETVFLQYLQDWKLSVDQRIGYTRLEKQKMFLTHQTYRGIIMTVKAFIAVTKYLLQNGVTYVLSNKFCQDPIEEHFGRHRWMGRTHDNPNIRQFGHQENSIRMQRDLSLMIQPRGNVTRQQNGSCSVSASPVKKKARK